MLSTTAQPVELLGHRQPAFSTGAIYGCKFKFAIDSGPLLPENILTAINVMTEDIERSHSVETHFTGSNKRQTNT
ncbi:hypothetical protein BgiMline_005976 [Biomphalaria glabrata]|nr:hypothetical protein BgiMline_003952 [Biomphalaria glabrata]